MTASRNYPPIAAYLIEDEHLAMVSLDELFVHEIQYTARSSDNHMHCNAPIHSKILN